jgi:hypothetical protein
MFKKLLINGNMRKLNDTQFSLLFKRITEDVKSIRESSDKKTPGTDTVASPRRGKHEAQSPKKWRVPTVSVPSVNQEKSKAVKRKRDDPDGNPPAKKVKVVRITEFKLRDDLPLPFTVNSHVWSDDDGIEYFPPADSPRTPVAAPQSLRTPVARPLTIEIPFFEGETVSVPVPVVDSDPFEYSDGEETDDEIPPNRICGTDDEGDVEPAPPIHDVIVIDDTDDEGDAKSATNIINHLVGMVLSRTPAAVEPESSSDTEMDDEDTDLDEDTEMDDDDDAEPSYDELLQVRANAYHVYRALAREANKESSLRRDLRDLGTVREEIKAKIASRKEMEQKCKRQTYGVIQQHKRDGEILCGLTNDGDITAVDLHIKIMDCAEKLSKYRAKMMRGFTTTLSKLTDSLDATNRQIADIRQEIRSFQPEEIARVRDTYEAAREACQTRWNENA